MRSSIIGILLLSITPVLSIAVLHAESQSKYTNQGNIDSTIMKGFYLLTEASSVAGVGFRQKDAIETAKRLTRELRAKAKGDPNERYILWKVGELESQIYLEEKDLMQQKRMQGQITTNDYITNYNAEVGKPRPDFATMKKIHTQVTVLDPKKANELADSYNNRYRAISREVLFSIEKSLMTGDDKKAKEELGYCLRNKNYLSIADSKYFKIEARVNGLCSAFQEKPLIEKELDSAEEFIRHFDLKQARTHIISARYRLQSVSQNLPQNVCYRLTSNIDKVNKLLTSKEDSLVNINLTILSKQGIKAADDFLQKILKASGVAREKSAYVDSVILIISSPEKNKMAEEIESVSQNDGNQISVFNDIRETARKKAQAKVDSMRLVDEMTLRNILAQKAINDSIIAARYEEQHKELKKNQENASLLTMRIYTFLEQNQIKGADELFADNQNFLRQFLVNDAYEILEMTIKQFMEPVNSQQITYVNPVTSPKKASLVSSTPPQPSESPSPDQENPDELLKKNQARAQQETIGIYSMLENNEMKAANNRFQSMRKQLQIYLPKEAFNILETTVVQMVEYPSEAEK